MRVVNALAGIVNPFTGGLIEVDLGMGKLFLAIYLAGFVSGMMFLTLWYHNLIFGH